MHINNATSQHINEFILHKIQAIIGQASVLGPLHLIRYLIDLPKYNLISFCFLAEYTSIYTFSNNEKMVGDS